MAPSPAIDVIVTKRPGIYKVFCYDCKRFLLEAPANTATYCPDCKRWTKQEPLKKMKMKGGGNSGP